MTTLTAILIVGPTGRFSLALCRALVLQKSKFKRIAVFHDTSRPVDETKSAIFAELEAAGLEIVRGTYTTVEAFEGFDVVVMALGNHAMKYQPRIIDTAILAGVRHFYPSEFGADLTVGENWNERYYRDKILTREHLEKRGKDTKDLGWTYVTVGRFSEWSVLPTWGFDHESHTARVYGTAESRQSLMAVPNIVQYTICTFLDSLGASTSQARQRTYRFYGGPYSWPEILVALEKTTGVKYRITYLDVEEAAEREKLAKETGDVELELEASHQLIQGREGTLLSKPYDNDRFPEVKMILLEDALRDALLG